MMKLVYRHTRTIVVCFYTFKNATLVFQLTLGSTIALLADEIKKIKAFRGRNTANTRAKVLAYNVKPLNLSVVMLQTKDESIC